MNACGLTVAGFWRSRKVRDMRQASITSTVAVAACLAAAPLPSHAQQDGEWKWMIAPYLWAANVSTDLATPFPVSEGGSRFPDLIDDIDGAFQAHLEVQNDKFGMFADFTYIGLGDNKDFERLNTDSQLDAYLFEAAAVWSRSEEHTSELQSQSNLVCRPPIPPLFPYTTLFRSGRIQVPRPDRRHRRRLPGASGSPERQVRHVRRLHLHRPWRQQGLRAAQHRLATRRLPVRGCRGMEQIGRAHV